MSDSQHKGANRATGWAEIEAAAQGRIRHLDVVRSCRDLKSTFPPHVEIRFVFWRHGRVNDFTDPAVLAPHLVDADTVGMEIVDVPLPPANVERTFELINKFVRRELTRDDLDEFNSTPRPVVRPMIQPIAERLRTDSQRNDLPVFLPIDDYAGQALPTYPPQRMGRFNERHLARDMRRRTKVKAYREQIVTRQLHRIATTALSQPTPRVLAAVMGEGHWLLERAVAELGARTSRVFATPRQPPLPTSLQETHSRVQGSYFGR